ncbi:MAG: type II toxin-antitoxin system PemK/MazF family toxin [Acidobacteria bacterium]|nr:type II toxin-antitoxin system PemK/MazF family toxin [Acidobacteriota bacterium]
MAARVNRGEIWRLHRAHPDKRRPVVVISRPSLIPLLHTVIVAAVTSTSRGAPTEVSVGLEEGLKQASCVNLCHLFTVPRSQLKGFVGVLGPVKMRELCRALAISTGCDA